MRSFPEPTVKRLAGSLLTACAVALLLVPPASADTLIVANKSEATVSLVDLESGAVRATLPTGGGPHEVAVSPDGRRALIANYGTRGEAGSTLTLIDVPAAEVVSTLELGEYRRPHGVVFLDDERAAVTVEGNRAVIVVDVAAGEVLRAIETGQEVSHMLAVDGARKRAYVANIGSGTITALDLEKGSKLGDVATGEGAEGIAVTPDGSQVWVTNRGADTVSLVDPESLEVVTTLESASFPIRAEVTPDGRHVLVTNARSGNLTVIDTGSRKVARRVSLRVEPGEGEGRLMESFASSVPIGIEIAPSGERAFIAHANADLVQIVDLESWKPVGAIEAGKEPDGMGYSQREAATTGDGE